MKTCLLVVVGTFLFVGGVAAASTTSKLSPSVLVSKSSKKTSSSSSPQILSEGENVFVRLAKSVAYEAMQEFSEEGRRNPRFGITMNLGNLTDLSSLFNSTNGSAGNLTGLAALAGVPVAIKVSSLGVRGNFLRKILWEKFWEFFGEISEEIL